MPQGVGYGPYAAAPPEDPLAALGLQMPGGMPPMAPLPPPPPGGGAAPQMTGQPAPGMPPMPMPPGAGGAAPMGGDPGAADPRIQAFLASKTPEELARMVVDFKLGGSAAGAKGY